MFAGCGQRGGTRGGADQFNWADVKGDKNKEFYLGQSLHAQDSNWIWADDAKGKHQEKPKEENEVKKIKELEENLRLEQLGLKPKINRRAETPLEKHEVDELFQRGASAEDLDSWDADRISGLGFSASRVHIGIENLTDAPKTISEYKVFESDTKVKEELKKQKKKEKKREKKEKKKVAKKAKKKEKKKQKLELFKKEYEAMKKAKEEENREPNRHESSSRHHSHKSRSERGHHSRSDSHSSSQRYHPYDDNQRHKHRERH